MAIVWSAVVGSALGPLVYFRSGHSGPELDRDDRKPVYRWLIDQLESIERLGFDWLTRERGLLSKKSESVVVVAIDDETLENARRSEWPEVAVQPWPRALLGGLVQEMLAEGAAQVVVDLPLFDLSPHPGPKGSALSDDESFRALLEPVSDKVVLGFDWAPAAPPPLTLPLSPWRVKVGNAPSQSAALELARRVISDRHPAYLFANGQGFAVWGGIGTEEEAEASLKKWRPGAAARSAEVTEFVASDRSHQISPSDFLVLRSEVKVEGLSPEGVEQARSLRPPLAVLMTEGLGIGADHPARDPDGVVRSISQLITYASSDGKLHLLPSSALAAMMQKVKENPTLQYRDGQLRIGNSRFVPMDPAGFSLLHFEAPEASFDPKGSLKRSISAWRVLVNHLDRRRGAMLHYDHALKGKVAVLTQTASDRTTWVRTPIGEFRGHGAVVGQAISNWMSSGGVFRATPKEDLSAIYVMAFVGALLALTFGRLFRSLAGVAAYFFIGALAVLGYGWFVREVFVTSGKWMALWGPLLSAGASFFLTSFYALRAEQQVTEFITGVLGRYASPEVARQVTKDLSLVRPERRSLTLFFADLDHFTERAERLPPKAVSSLLSEFFTAATDVIRQSNGQVDKFLGDGLMAFWGAPIRSTRHAKIACESALRLLNVVREKQADWEKRLGEPLVFRAGLNTGEVVVGDLGSFRKPAYTALGTAVNWAAALEKLNRRWGTYLLAGERTVQDAGEHFVFREVARESGAKVFELVCHKKDLTDAHAQRLFQFSEAYGRFVADDFEGAAAGFHLIKDVDPVAAVYWEECQSREKGGQAAFRR